MRQANRDDLAWLGNFGPDRLDEFVALVDRIGGPAVPEFASVAASFGYRPQVKVEQSLDPYSGAYFDQMLALYGELSGRELDQASGELTDFDLARHVAAANPYASPT